MTTNSKTKSIEVRCTHCNTWFNSAIWIGDRTSFETGSFYGNMQSCPNCGKLTGCNKENFRARFEDGGFIGSDA